MSAFGLLLSAVDSSWSTAVQREWLPTWLPARALPAMGSTDTDLCGTHIWRGVWLGAQTAGSAVVRVVGDLRDRRLIVRLAPVVMRYRSIHLRRIV
jgi:hypothetical protein